MKRPKKPKPVVVWERWMMFENDEPHEVVPRGLVKEWREQYGDDVRFVRIVKPKRARRGK